MKSLQSLAIAVTTALALAPLPAQAADGAETGLSTLETVGIFVLGPVSIYGVIWLLWSIPKWRREASAPATGETWNPRPAK
jgi:hypothetical protein